MVMYACHQFEILIATEDPFPSPNTARVWAARVWADASCSTPTRYRLCSRIEKLITDRSSHARGALRDRIRPLIASTYGFTPDGSARAKQQNTAKYVYLLDRDAHAPDARFHYADVEKRQGFAHNPVILSTIKEFWFATPDAAGIKYAAQFSPVREVTLALLMTTIEYCLDQWATGLWDKNLTFSNKVYRPKYEQHLCHVREWGSLDPASSQLVRQRMYDRARRASGAAPETLPPAGLSEAARDRLRLDLASQAAGEDADQERDT
ncbi:hypothetical protein NUW54_g12584 [Trametes sanguinea]|uniref:Uncharacterized protein n=1 Tax=Trametes sanguinea TaxID=158606 RepID=A0ACC1MY15_9APHY|nr:hypothetical protein NUW54_g12584 [Trametes sanguinea]